MKAIGVERTLPATWRLPDWRRMAFLLVTALCAAILLLRLQFFVAHTDGIDFDVYRRAAASWIESGNPYLYAGASGAETYRYAPWVAALWVPLAGLPRLPLLIGWDVLLFAATGLLMIALVRDHGERGLPLALLGGALLVSTSSGGNLQPLLVTGLYLTLHRRSGPLAVGIAASVKIFPILYVIPWIGRREWSKVVTAVGVMAALYAPILLFQVPAVALDPGAAYWPSPLLWIAVGGASVVAAVLLARSRYAWVAAGAATVLTIPRLLALDLSMILPAASRQHQRPDEITTGSSGSRSPMSYTA